MPLRVATAVLLAAAAAGAQPTTTTLTSGAHPASACHGNGLVQPDTEPLFADQHPVSAAPATRCECFPCYTGADCSEYAETSAANCAPLDASVGTAVMAEYWENQWNDSTLATPVPPFYRCEYQDPTVMPAFLEGQNANTLEAINRLHEATGNAVSRNKNVMLGDGATEVMRLVLAAIAAVEGHPMTVTARAPYYPNFEYWGDENPLRATFAKNVSGVDPAHLVEIITYPNNPDGKFYEPLYPKAKYHVYDMVYYWPHIVDIPKAVDFPIMVFSMSKLTGMAASRVGWALLNSANLAFNTIGTQSIETYSVASEAQWRASRVMAALTTSHEAYFTTTRNKTDARWAELEELFKDEKAIGRPGRFTLESHIGFWIWIACNDPADNCGEVFEKVGIEGRFYKGETGVQHHNRLSVMMRDTSWTVLKTRLAALLAEK